MELWQQSTDGWLRLSTYDRTGGVRGAVARLAERSYGGLTPSQRDAARAVFLRLVANEDDGASRRRVPLDEFDADRDPVTAAVLARLTEDRLLTRDEDSVEVAHEALLREWPRLRGWMEDDAAGRQLRAHLTRAAKQWASTNRDPAELYRGARLSAAQDWSTAHGAELNDLEREFVQESRQAGERDAERQRRTNRRLKALLAGVAAFLVLALVAGSLAIVQRGKARRSADAARKQATVADAQRLGALAIVEQRPDLALLLAAQGYRLDHAPETRGALFQTLMKYPHMLGLQQPTGQRVLRMEAPPQGQAVAVSDYLGGLVLYHGESLAPLHEPIELPFTNEMVFAPDGKALFIAGWKTETDAENMVLRSLDVGSGNVRWTVPIVASRFRERQKQGLPGDGRLSITPEGRSVAWQTGDRIHLYDVRDGSALARTITTIPDHVALFLPAGGLLQLAERHVLISDLATGRVIHDWAVTVPFGGGVDVSSDGNLLALGGWNGVADGVVAVVDLRTGNVREMRGQHTGWVPDVAFLLDGSLLASAGDDGNVYLWDAASGEQVAALVGHTSRLRGLAVADSGRTLVSGGLDNTMIAWDLAGDRALVREAPRPGPFCDGCAFAQLAPTPDGRRIALIGGDHRVRFVDAETLQPVGALPETVRDCCQPPAFSPAGDRLAAIDFDRSVLWLRDATTGEAIRKLFDSNAESTDPNAPAMDSVAYAPNGSSVATNENADVLVTDPETGTILARLRTGDFVQWVSYSPDGRLLEAATNDGRITVWNTTTYQQVWSRKVDSDAAVGGQFSPDGRLLIAGSFTGRIHVLDAATGEPARAPLLAHAAVVGSLNFSPDGTTFATSGVDGLTYLWDANTGRALGTPFDGRDAVVNAFSIDGKTLYVNSYNTIYAFDVDPEALIDRACNIAQWSLTHEEWDRYLPDRPYDPPCAAGAPSGL